MKSRTLRSLRRLLPVLGLTLVLVQLGPLTSRAFAHIPLEECGPDIAYETRDQTLQDGTIVVWQCLPFEGWGYDWYEVDMKPGTQKSVVKRTSSSSPPYKMLTHSIIGEGQGGGDFVGAIDLRNPNLTDLVRRVRVRIIVRYQSSPTSTWYACHDTNWQEAPSQRARFDINVQQYTQPDCGKAYYEAKVGAEFYSISQNTWVFPGWVLSGSLYLSGPCCVAPGSSTRSPSSRP
jgi:hypothetical protein